MSIHILLSNTCAGLLLSFCVCVYVCVCEYMVQVVVWGDCFSEKENVCDTVHAVGSGRHTLRERKRPKKDELDPVAEHEKWINVWNNTLREPIMALATRPWKEQLHLNFSSTFPRFFIPFPHHAFVFLLTLSLGLFNKWMTCPRLSVCLLTRREWWDIFWSNSKCHQNAIYAISLVLLLCKLKSISRHRQTTNALVKKLNHAMKWLQRVFYDPLFMICLFFVILSAFVLKMNGVFSMRVHLHPICASLFLLFFCPSSRCF